MNPPAGRAWVLGFQVDAIPFSLAIRRCAGWLRQGTPALVVTANPVLLEAARRDPELAAILHQADLIVPDGIGILWALRRSGIPCERIPGIELAEALLAIGGRDGWSVYLVGGKFGVAERAAHRLQKKYPTLRIAGTHHGYFSESEEATVLEKIRHARPSLVLAGLGARRQEKFCWRGRRRLGFGLWIGVGGSLDVFCGDIRRAPALARRAGLEWAYRFLRQPSRLRHAPALASFAGRVLRHT